MLTIRSNPHYGYKATGSLPSFTSGTVILLSSLSMLSISVCRVVRFALLWPPISNWPSDVNMKLTYSLSSPLLNPKRTGQART